MNTPWDMKIIKVEQLPGYDLTGTLLLFLFLRSNSSVLSGKIEMFSWISSRLDIFLKVSEGAFLLVFLSFGEPK